MKPAILRLSHRLGLLLMRGILFLLLLWCAYFLHMAEAHAQEPRQNFTVKSRDGVELAGDITTPKKSGKSGAVLFVPGTGLFDRHISYGGTRTKNDFLFESLQSKILAAGYAVIRYDLRGVSCNYTTAPMCTTCATPQSRYQHYVKSCVDNKIRGTVNPENMRDDIEAVFRYAQSHVQLVPEQIVVLAHAEGTAHVVPLAGRQAISPKAIMLMSPVLSSPVDVMKWQLDGVIDQWLTQLLGAADTLANAKIETAYATWAGSYSYPLSALLAAAPKTGWTRSELAAVTKERQQNYEQARVKVRAAKPGEPFGYTDDVTHASYGWWQWWNSEESPTAKNLGAFAKPVYVYYGMTDPKFDIRAQLAHVGSAASESAPLNVSIRVFPKVGHSLGSHGLFGPISATAEDALMADLTRELTVNSAARK